MRGNLPSLAYFSQEYNTAKKLGTPALACNAVLVLQGFDDLRLLIQSFTMPIATHNDAADIDYAGGLAAHRAGIPKTSFESSATFIETESGQIHRFAEALMSQGGSVDSARVLFGQSDGKSQTSAVYEIQDVTITFSDGGGEIDATSRSSILTVSGSMRYMYFGDNAKLGNVGNQHLNGINSSLNSGNSSALNRFIDGAVNAINGLPSLSANTNVFTPGFGG